MPKKQINSNCLHGMQCPRCNSFEPFAIGITTTVRVYNCGVEDQLGDNNWDESSYCECCKCSFAARVADFTLTQAKKATA
jgi:Zn ribbon nucleic-acid-binding protein